MTQFEYLAIAFSIVFSFSAARFVSGLAPALEPARRYFPHAAFLMNGLFATASVFWAFWSFRDVQWNFVRFLFALASPGLLYFLACTLVPDLPSSVVSWRHHFFQVRHRFYLGLGAWILVVGVNSTISIGLPLRHPARVMPATAYLALSAPGSTPSLSASPTSRESEARPGTAAQKQGDLDEMYLPGSYEV